MAQEPSSGESAITVVGSIINCLIAVLLLKYLNGQLQLRLTTASSEDNGVRDT